MAYINYEQHATEYQKLWDTMHIIRDAAELERTSDKIKLHKEVYQKVEKETGVPWQMVAVIHVREAGLSDVGVWKGVLHNGEKIVGTGRKTRLVPTGKGPFDTWHQAAVAALKDKGFDKIKPWPVSRMLWALEPFNGYGYRNKGLRSPYLWASTNHQQPGKYVADHKFDPTVMDTQVGCAALLKFLEVGKSHEAVAPGAVIAAGGAAVAASPQHTWPWIIGGTAIAALIAWAIVRWYNRRQLIKTEVNDVTGN